MLLFTGLLLQKKHSRFKKTFNLCARRKKPRNQAPSLLLLYPACLPPDGFPMVGDGTVVARHSPLLLQNTAPLDCAVPRKKFIVWKKN